MKRILVLIATLFCINANAQMTVETIYETPDSQINLYIVSQGFTNSCMPQFDTFVNGYLSYMWSKAPYSTMQSKFRVIKVQIPSSQEHVPSAYFQFEFLNATQIAPYICDNNPNSTNPCTSGQYQYQQNECYSDFKDRMDDLKTQLPGFNNKSYILAVFNNNYYTGGGGEYCFATTFCGSPLMHRVLLHEFSHTFGLLGDEYSSTVASRNENCQIILDSNGNQVMIGADEYPLFHDRNVTNKTNLTDIPWNYLIPNNTPIPTCNASNSLPTCGSTTVGLFEGATYETTGWFRPKHTCLMRDLYSNSVFCEVCRDLTQERINEHLCTATNTVSENFVSRHQYITHWRKASNTLTSDSDIGNGISVNFVSGNSIKLTEGFKASAGSEFKAYIGDCSTIELNSTYKMTTNHTDMVIMKQSAENIKSSATEDIDEITIYPNPNSDGFLNVISTKKGKLNIVITDMLGKEVVNTKVINNTVSVANLTSGIYIVKITEEGKTSTKKLIIE